MVAHVLVSGASIAGPAVAYWLSRYGFDVTVVEQAPDIRSGGQAVDFKGPIHRTVLERMGVLDAIRAAHVPNPDGIIVNARGRKVATIPGSFGGGEINVPRGDLARILYQQSATDCEYVFGDSITSLTESTAGVDVTFAHAPQRTFDLVIGADGLHSNVRSLVFGPESSYVRHLGYYYALATLDSGDDDLMYTEPGRTAAIGGLKAPAWFVFASDAPRVDRDDIASQKQCLTDAFADAKWSRLPALMAQLSDATDFYLDSVSRVTLDHYAKGRVALLGDAAYGNTLGGYGTGLAVVGGYVLAGELARTDRDHRASFAAYEDTFRDYASISQKVNAGRLMAPRTRPGVWLRNLMFSTLSLASPLMTMVERPATNIDLRDYPRIAQRG